MAIDTLAKQVLTELFREQETGDGYISEGALAQRLGLGRPQLREIVERLNVFGRIEKKQKFGIRLREADAVSRRTLFDLREMLEGYVAEHLEGRLSGDDFATLEFHARMHERALESHDGAAMASHDFQFHQILIERAALPLMNRLFEQLSLLELSLFGFKASGGDAGIRNPIRHAAIIAALRRSVQEGAEVLRRHIRWIADTVCNPAPTTTSQEELP
jgi:DNA-binding GntR family transcriptional regulator